jgi:hypothetical protein
VCVCVCVCVCALYGAADEKRINQFCLRPCNTKEPKYDLFKSPGYFEPLSELPHVLRCVINDSVRRFALPSPNAFLVVGCFCTRFIVLTLPFDYCGVCSAALV